MKRKRKKIEKVHRVSEDIPWLADDATQFDGPEFDEGIIGTYETGDGEHGLVYGYNRLVRALAKAWNVDESEAIEWIEYNTLRTIPYMGPHGPIVIWETEEFVTEDLAEPAVGAAKHERKSTMKKEAKTTAPVKALAKTITKPQTVDVTGMKVISVTLTDKGKLVIKYVK